MPSGLESARSAAKDVRPLQYRYDGERRDSAQNQKDNLQKEAAGMKADQEKWNSIVQPLIELVTTLTAFVSGGEGKAPAPEAIASEPNTSQLGGGFEPPTFGL